MQPAFDAAVIGGGPAGLSAATWLARYRAQVVLFDTDEQRNREARHIHGYLGLDPASPTDFLAAARSSLDRYENLERRGVPVTEVTGALDAFTVRAGDDAVRVRRVVFATGLTDVVPEVEGFADHYGTSVFHCVSCDGYENRDRSVALIAATAGGAEHALDLRRWTDRLMVVLHDVTGAVDFAPVRQVLDDAGIPVRDAVVRRFCGEPGAFTGLELDDGESVEVEAAFFSFGHLPRSGLAHEAGCDVDEDGFVVTDHHGATSVRGIFACGDCTRGAQLVQLAAAQGTSAGIACAKSL